MESIKSADVIAPSPDVAPGHPRELLRSFLRDRSAASDERWRRWCADLVKGGRLRPTDLSDWWTAINEFDPVLAQYAAEPVTVPDTTVVVAGSGKEQFKTFNVSTAAAILAAAAGTPVVKGISRSVSAVSGAADILDILGVTPVARPAAIQQALQRRNIAFVAYPVFCPHYAARYDGVFDSISPASFFMPVATVCVRASGFVLGLAHADVALAALALRMIRPDIATGVVVSTDLSHGETVDEYSDVGTVRLARVAAGALDSTTHTNPEPARHWRRAVAHQPTHRGNAALVADALTATGDTPCTRLVELNASLIVGTTATGCRPDEGIARVHHARRSGRAMRLLTELSESR
ncbi:hypothetical protein [Frankia sp. Cr1]|uniref:hypothetical protein n=1 Tax=Frankia sp. Cr1 TaxID=3073931 RepID=UPI002AD30593|nr:hypothetical protein [Frankia sp. Cr1]